MSAKRLSARSATLLVAVGLLTTACGGAGGGGESEPAASAESKGSLGAVEEVAAMVPEDFRDEGKLVVAQDPVFPPLEMLDEDNKTIVGFGPDLARAVGEVMGLEVEIERAAWDGLVAGVDAGRYDMALSSILDTLERQEVVDFVDYLESGVGVMVTEENPEGVSGQESLCGMTVSVAADTSGDLAAQGISDECVGRGEEPLEIEALDDTPAALQALQTGRSDAMVSVSITLSHAEKQAPEAFKVVGEFFSVRPIGAVFAKESDELRDAFQAGLQHLMDEGVYDDLLEKWGLEEHGISEATVNAGKE